ncbi:MAG: fumarylacetoacetate hydrolase family protein [Candidatus Latescibacterota bacterium]|jgi:2-keto-4-pentenoate hydratase/2-oxohepta-3-ene-1,7-dioic acid hydratase in catechol pathway
MKLITYTRAGEERLGAVLPGERFAVDLAVADQTLARGQKRPACPFLGGMIDLLEAGTKGMAAARAALRLAEERLAKVGKADGRLILALSHLRLRAPVPRPRKVFCLAGNYQDHIEEGGRARMEIQDRETPRIFMKPPSTTVIGPGDRILIPPVAHSVDWEGELAVVIGRRAKGVKAAQALGHVAGYTVMNDVSERQLEIKQRTDSRPRDQWFDWLNGKWLDTFAPHGPWLVTRDEIPDPQTLEISTYVNGERKQHNHTGQMLYPVDRIIEYLSTIITLEPGDLISTGTIAGIGATTGTFLQPGDRVEIQITGIGALRNPVAASRR